jgi:hypothetical protein
VLLHDADCTRTYIGSLFIDTIVSLDRKMD